MLDRPSLGMRFAATAALLAGLASSVGRGVSHVLSMAGSDAPGFVISSRRGSKGTGRRAPKRQQKFKTWHRAKRKAKAKARRRRMRRG